MEGFIVKGWETILPGCAGSMYDPQPISDRPAILGFPHHAGRFRPGGSPFSSPGCRSCRCMEGFLIRGWDPVVPGWRWLYFRAPANQQSVSRVGFSTRPRRFRPGGSPLSSPGCRSCRCMEGVLNREWGLILPVCGEIVGFPERQLPPRAPRPFIGQGRAAGVASRETPRSRRCLLYTSPSPRD